MTRVIRGIAGLAAALLLAACGGGSDDKKAAATQAKPAVTVTLAAAERSEWPVRLEAHGNIAAWQEAIIGAQVNGLRIEDVRVNVGDTVKQGQVLATFVAETSEAELAQQGAAVAEAQAAFEEAEANAKRRRALAESGAARRQEIEQYATAARTAQARLSAAQAAARASEVRLSNTRVVAPDDGVISARNATVGAVTPAGQELFRLIRKGRLEWRAEVTADALPRIRVGQDVRLVLPGGGEARGRVRTIGPTIDPQTRNGTVFVDVGAGEARAGMFARGTFDLGSAAAITVPQQALVIRDGFAYVFLVGQDNRVQQRKVEAGRRNGDRVEIVKGLEAGAQVVAAGAGFLNDGDLVQVAGGGKG